MIQNHSDTAREAIAVHVRAILPALMHCSQNRNKFLLHELGPFPALDPGRVILRRDGIPVGQNLADLLRDGLRAGPQKPEIHLDCVLYLLRRLKFHKCQRFKTHCVSSFLFPTWGAARPKEFVSTINTPKILVWLHSNFNFLGNVRLSFTLGTLFFCFGAF